MVEVMETGAVIERVRHIGVVRDDVDASADVIESGLVSLRELTAWADAQHAVLAGRLAQLDSFAESRLAAAAKSSLGAAAKTTARARTLDATPELARRLDDGLITAGHVDAVTRASSQLDESRRAELFRRVD